MYSKYIWLVSQLLIYYTSERRLTFTDCGERSGKCPPRVKEARPTVVLAFFFHFRFSFAADNHSSNYRFRLQYKMSSVGVRFAIAGLHLQAPRVPGDALPATFTYVGKSYSESVHVYS